MKRFIKTAKVLAILAFFVSVIYFFYYKVCINDKMEGSFLNGSKIEDGRFYLEDNEGNFIEVEENEWNILLVKTRIFKLCLIYIIIFMFVVWMRFLIIPNIKKYIKLLSGES